MAKILLADSNIKTRSRIAVNLRRWGYTVEESSDGLEALNRINSESFDLVIADADLPGINGLGILEVSRNQDSRNTTIIMADRANIEHAQESIRRGAYDFILKSYGPGEIQKIVFAALENSRLNTDSNNGGNMVAKSNFRFRESLIRAAADSILAGLAFWAAFILYDSASEAFGRRIFIGQVELIQMSFGFAFCYAFVFVFNRNYRPGKVHSGGGIIRQVWLNLTQSYLIYMGVLFLVKDAGFYISRVIVGLGYISGLALLLLNRILIMPLLMSPPSREGKRRLVLVASKEKDLEKPLPVDKRTDESKVVIKV